MSEQARHEAVRILGCLQGRKIGFSALLDVIESHPAINRIEARDAIIDLNADGTLMSDFNFRISLPEGPN